MRASLLAASALAVAASAQTTWIVAPTGGSFPTIGQAIAAAQPGDIVVVRPGAYPGFTLSKGLRILADPGANLNGIGQAVVAIQNLPAGETALVRGFGSIAAFGNRFDLRNNLGHVHLESTIVNGGIAVADCAQVSLTGVQARSAPALQVQRSTLLAASCSLAGIAHTTPALSTALSCDASAITLADSPCVAALTFPIFPPVTGIWLQSGSLDIAGDASTIVAAAQGNAAATPAITTLAGSLRIDPAVQLLPNGGAPPISGPASVSWMPIARTQASAGQGQLTATLQAKGAQTGWLLAGPALQPVLVLPLGQLWLGAAHLVLDGGPIPPAGSRSVTLTLPPLDSGTLAVLQGVVVRTPGSFELATPVATTLAP